MTTERVRKPVRAATGGVLVATGDRDLLEHVEALLADSASFSVRATAADAEAALRNISARRGLSAVVLDVDVARVLAPAIARRLGTVVVGRRPSVEDYKAALAARAVDLLEVPLSPGTLESALRDAAERTRSHDGPHGMLVVVTAPKGGCGATTTTVHVANRMNASGASVCVVELGDPAGGVRTLLHSSWEPRPPLSEVLATGQDLSDEQLRGVATPDGSTFAVLEGPAAPPGAAPDPRVLATLLWRLETLYDVVLVDAGNSAAAPASWPMADRVLVVVTPDWQCMAAARTLLEKSHENEPAVLVNRSARADDIQPSTVESLLGVAPVTVLPQCFGDLQRAAHAGAPARVQNQDWQRALDVLCGELRLAPSLAR